MRGLSVELYVLTSTLWRVPLECASGSGRHHVLLQYHYPHHAHHPLRERRLLGTHGHDPDHWHHPHGQLLLLLRCCFSLSVQHVRLQPGTVKPRSRTITQPARAAEDPVRKEGFRGRSPHSQSFTSFLPPLPGFHVGLLEQHQPDALPGKLPLLRLGAVQVFHRLHHHRRLLQSQLRHLWSERITAMLVVHCPIYSVRSDIRTGAQNCEPPLDRIPWDQRFSPC